VSIVDQRAEFVALARSGEVSIRRLCRCFHVAPATAYKWLQRAAQDGPTWFEDRSRQPQRSPTRTAAAVEAAILELRGEHPAWGGRKLAAYLRELGHTGVPSASTITAILRRNGRLAPSERPQHAWERFERPVANQLWQMDFKGHVPLGQGQGRVHPLTVLDDHSRYCIVLGACANERGATVRERLIGAFRTYGLPDCLLADNGGPWGDGRSWTSLGVWLLQVGVGLIHGRPYHPQTQGKEERFHRTLKVEVLQGPPHANLGRVQQAFDRWRDVYNLQRPHEACGLKPPVSRYRPSDRCYPERLPPVEYTVDFLVRRVRHHGGLSFHGRDYHIGEGFAGQPLGFLASEIDGVWQVHFGRFAIGTLNELERSYRPIWPQDDASRTNHAK
jgi:transposase InsO family protein